MKFLIFLILITLFFEIFSEDDISIDLDTSHFIYDEKDLLKGCGKFSNFENE